jgi:hypothetical protein
MTGDLNKKDGEALRSAAVRAAWLSSVVWLACLACGGSSSSAAATAGGATPARAGPVRIDLALDAPNGLSGLTRRGDGTLFAIAETDRFLVTIAADRVARVVPLHGVPDGLDAEAIAWLEGERFVIGTESLDAARTEEQLYVVEVGEDAARVVETIVVPISAIGGGANENEGIEGICHVDGSILVATEHVEQTPSGRVATVGVYARDTGAWNGRLLRLTTDTGKIAGMDCRAHDGRIEVFAIERHYEVMRVLRFDLDPALVRDAERSPIEPVLVLDLAGTLEGDPNLEGLAVSGDEIAMIVDNHYGRRTGPNELVRFPGLAR